MISAAGPGRRPEPRAAGPGRLRAGQHRRRPRPAAGIRVVRVPGSSAQPVAELTFGLLLALVRKVALADRLLREGHWPKAQLGGPLLAGKTLGIVGAGRIGSRVGEMGAAWGMRAHRLRGQARARRSADALAERGVTLTDFDTVVRRGRLPLPAPAARRGDPPHRRRPGPLAHEGRLLPGEHGSRRRRGRARALHRAHRGRPRPGRGARRPRARGRGGRLAARGPAQRRPHPAHRCDGAGLPAAHRRAGRGAARRPRAGLPRRAA